MARLTDNLPLVGKAPVPIQSMEVLCDDMWKALKSCTVDELKMLKPTGKYVRLIDVLIEIRMLMGD